jgi:hypothetical protein
MPAGPALAPDRVQPTQAGLWKLSTSTCAQLHLTDHDCVFESASYVLFDPDGEPVRFFVGCCVQRHHAADYSEQHDSTDSYGCISPDRGSRELRSRSANSGRNFRRHRLFKRRHKCGPDTGGHLNLAVNQRHLSRSIGDKSPLHSSARKRAKWKSQAWCYRLCDANLA